MRGGSPFIDKEAGERTSLYEGVYSLTSWLLRLFVRGIHYENLLFCIFVCRLPNVLCFEGCDLWGLFPVRFHDGWVIHYLWSFEGCFLEKNLSVRWMELFFFFVCVFDRSDQTFWPLIMRWSMFELWSQMCQLVSVFKDLYEMTYSLFHLYGEICIGILSRDI